MTPLRFTLLTRQHGIYRRSVGLAAAHDLAKLAKKPAPMIRRVWADRAKRPCEQGTKAIIIGNGKWMPQKGGSPTAPPPQRQTTRPAPRPNSTRRPPPGTVGHPPIQEDDGSDIVF